MKKIIGCLSLILLISVTGCSKENIDTSIQHKSIKSEKVNKRANNQK